MEDYFISMGISVLLSLIQTKIPNDPNAHNKWKAALAKIFRAIATAYPNDPMFKV